MAKKAVKRRGHGASVAPTCSCLVLCDDVVVSHARDKHRLEGIIGAITVPFPGHPGPGGVVYVRVSNVHQDQKLTVRLIRADDDHQPLWEIEAQLVNQNAPLHVYTLMAKVPPFLVQHAGRYVLEARHKDIPIASVPIEVRTLFPAPPQGWPGDQPEGTNP